MASMLLTLTEANRRRSVAVQLRSGRLESLTKSTELPPRGTNPLFFARSQVWGTRKRYLMYTAAGFVALGGLGAAWSHRPPAVEHAAASQFAGAQAADQLMQSTAHNAPAWVQRLMADLAAQSDTAAQPIQVAAAEDRAITLPPRDIATPRLKPAARSSLGKDESGAPEPVAATAATTETLSDMFVNPAPMPLESPSLETNPFEPALSADLAARTVPDEPWFTSDETIAEEIAS